MTSIAVEVPKFVIATELVPSGRRNAIANGMVAIEPIISSNDDLRRRAWTAKNGPLGLTHCSGV
jgi:hypothetical protein